jgi:uridine kinase
MNIIAEVSDSIMRIKKTRPIIVAFDGVDTSGKTTLADNIYKNLKSKKQNVLRVSIDKFHNTKEIRMAKGDLSPEGFFEDSFNLDQILENVIFPIKKGTGYIITGVFDYRNEIEIQPNKIMIDNNLIVLFDGIFMNRDELYKYWDLSVFLDISFETVLKRAVIRDKDYFGSEEEVYKRYNKRYIPGEQLYLTKCKPKERANIVIDNNDWDNPILMKGEYS